MGSVVLTLALASCCRTVLYGWELDPLCNTDLTPSDKRMRAIERRESEGESEKGDRQGERVLSYTTA